MIAIDVKLDKFLVWFSILLTHRMRRYELSYFHRCCLIFMTWMLWPFHFGLLLVLGIYKEDYLHNLNVSTNAYIEL